MVFTEAAAMSALARPVDLVHLARYTGGDRALNAEVLQLFVDQSATLLRDLQTVVESRDIKTWKYVTHSIKGAARCIGAFALADVAAEAEPIDPSVQTAEALAAIAALQAKAESVHLFIRGYLGR
jgi:HPt (histidine-containing phosphotransfer) domain-containing protein